MMRRMWVLLAAVAWVGSVAALSEWEDIGCLHRFVAAPTAYAGDTAPTPAVPKAAIFQGGAVCSADIVVPANRPLRLTATGSSGVVREWRVWPKSAAADILLDAIDKDGTPVLVLFPSDVVSFTVQQIATGAAGQISDVAVQVTVQGVPPVNPPEPGPVPPAPKPARVIDPGKLWLMVFVSDLTQQTATQADIERSTQLRKAIDSRGNHFRWMDPTTTPEDFRPWLEKARAIGLPRVLVVDAGVSPAVVVESAGLVDESSAVSLVRKWGGP